MAKNIEINLGSEALKGPCCAMQQAQESPVHYPTIHIEHAEEIDLPTTGTATVRFKVIRKVEETRDGKDWYQCDIEVQSLSDVKSAEGGAMFKSSGKDTEDALDKLAEHFKRKMDHEGED